MIEWARARDAGALESAAALEVTDTAFVRLRAAQVSIAAACALAGRSRATHYRHQVERPGPVHGPHRARRPPPSTITADERAQVLALLNSEPYRDLAIPWLRRLARSRRSRPVGVRARAALLVMVARRGSATASAQSQERLTMLPSLSMSTRWAAGVAPRPGMVRMSPQIG